MNFARAFLVTVLAACSAGERCPDGNVNCMCWFTDCPCIDSGDGGVCTAMDREPLVDAGADAE